MSLLEDKNDTWSTTITGCTPQSHTDSGLLGGSWSIWSEHMPACKRHRKKKTLHQCSVRQPHGLSRFLSPRFPMPSQEEKIDDLCSTLSNYNSTTTLLKDAPKNRWNRLNSVGWIVFYSIKWRNVSPLLFSLECCLHCWTNNWWWVAQMPLLFISFPFETLPSQIHVHALMIKHRHQRSNVSFGKRLSEGEIEFLHQA